MDKIFIVFFVGIIIFILFNIACLISGPAINKKLTYDCKSLKYLKYSDDYEETKENFEKEIEESTKNNYSKKKENKLCKKKKVMYVLEYTVFIFNFVASSIILLLTIYSYFGSGSKSSVFTLGSITFISGIISFTISLVYLIYSISVYKKNTNGTPKTDENGVFAKWNINKNAYMCLFFEEDDYYSIYAKYNELGKKQYNYNKKLYMSSKNDNTSEIYKCKYLNLEQEDWTKYFECDKINYFKVGNGQYNECENLYVYPIGKNSNSDLNKRWIASIILISIIILFYSFFIIIGKLFTCVIFMRH